MKVTLISIFFTLALFGQECNGLGKNAAIFSNTLTGITAKLHSHAVEEAAGGNVVLSPFRLVTGNFLTE